MMFLLFFLTKLNIVHLATQSYENQLEKTKLNDKKRKKKNYQHKNRRTFKLMHSGCFFCAECRDTARRVR